MKQDPSIFQDPRLHWWNHQPQALETLKGRFDCSEEERRQAEAASNEEKQRNKDDHESVLRNVQHMVTKTICDGRDFMWVFPAMGVP